MNVDCEVCKQTMNEGCGCLVEHYEIGRFIYSRIKVGDADDLFDDLPYDYICRDCNAGYGQFHHSGCSKEVCPHCKSQAFLCDCVKAVNQSVLCLRAIR